MKKALALLLALIMVLSLGAVAWADGVTLNVAPPPTRSGRPRS